MAATVPRRGVVSRFDEQVGLGSVAATTGEEFRFHLTAISDGTRDIAVGAQVAFTVTADPVGGREATALVKLDADP